MSKQIDPRDGRHFSFPGNTLGSLSLCQGPYPGRGLGAGSTRSVKAPVRLHLLVSVLDLFERTIEYAAVVRVE